MTGIACPFISCIPTKVSQLWFGEEQRTLATILVGMSNPMGLVLGSAVTPLIVTSPDRQDIQSRGHSAATNARSPCLLVTK